jgi:hypothetical protein
MTDVTTGNPWKLDSTGAKTTNPTYVYKFVWTPTTDGDDISVTDNGGNEIWAYKAIAGDSNQAIEYEKLIENSVNGITVTTIDNGTLWVYF